MSKRGWYDTDNDDLDSSYGGYAGSDDSSHYHQHRHSSYSGEPPSDDVVYGESPSRD